MTPAWGGYSPNKYTQLLHLHNYWNNSCAPINRTGHPFVLHEHALHAWQTTGRWERGEGGGGWEAWVWLTCSLSSGTLMRIVAMTSWWSVAPDSMPESSSRSDTASEWWSPPAAATAWPLWWRYIVSWVVVVVYVTMTSQVAARNYPMFKIFLSKLLIETW